MRGALYTDRYILNSAKRELATLQAKIRGDQARLYFDSFTSDISTSAPEVSYLQALIRGKIGRRNLARFKTAVISHNKDPTVISLQSAIRAKRIRNTIAETKAKLHSLPLILQ